MSKGERHTAIRDLLGEAGAREGAIASQDELRRRLRSRGFDVTQATLSRDIRTLALVKGPAGYLLPYGGGPASERDEVDDGMPALGEVLDSFALRVRQAQNLLVLHTILGGAQPVAAALDRESLAQVVGTVAGDDTVLLVCSDNKAAAHTARLLTRMIG
jgi:transcriptional regulator of arginine metabolism